MAAKKTDQIAVPTKEERLNSLIIQYADFQHEETAIRKAKEYLRAEIESLFPPIKNGDKESVVEVDGISAKLYHSGTTVVDPEKLYSLEEYRDVFWRLAKVSVTDAKAILPDDVLHGISRVVLSLKPQLLIRAKRED